MLIVVLAACAHWVVFAVAFSVFFFALTSILITIALTVAEEDALSTHL
jgi:hypothetical protein